MYRDHRCYIIAFFAIKVADLRFAAAPLLVTTHRPIINASSPAQNNAFSYGIK